MQGKSVIRLLVTAMVITLGLLPAAAAGQPETQGYLYQEGQTPSFERAAPDTTALAEAYAVLDAVKPQDYTVDSWNESGLYGCRAMAYEVLYLGSHMSQTEIDQLTDDIWAGIRMLVPRGDLTGLAELLEQVEADWARMVPGIYGEAERNAFLRAYHDAQKFLGNSTAAANYTQDMVDGQYAALWNAWEDLKAAPVNAVYTDVPVGQWYYDAVDFVTRYGFMNGMDGHVFGAAGNVNRAQFVTILYRIAGQPAVCIDNPFADVPAGRWYTDAVLWAYEKGITAGTDASHFAPEGILVRQNMVTFMLRFANTMGIRTDSRADFSGYTDARQVMPHARDAMQWAVAEGIISGMSETTLAPNGTANRAQIAAIISRFVPKYLW